MPLSTEFTRRFHLIHPVIQAPMAGGSDTPELAAAVAEAGALGFIGAAYLSPAQILEAARAVRAKTQKPFGINLFAPQPEPAVDGERTAAALEALRPYHAEFDLDVPIPGRGHSFDEQLEAALETGMAAFSFTFGMLPRKAVSAIQSRGVYLMGTATRTEEAMELERAGVDAVIAQGSEAGGHRGTFMGADGQVNIEAGMVGTMALVPQIADAVAVPVIASGGIMDGRGLAAALTLGAAAVQMGTAFLTCAESGASAAYREAILNANEDATGITRAFSGRPARGIINRFMREMERGEQPKAILPFPLQNGLTRSLRTAAAKQGRAEFLSLWAGQGLRMARKETAAGLIARLDREATAALNAMDKKRAQ